MLLPGGNNRHIKLCRLIMREHKKLKITDPPSVTDLALIKKSRIGAKSFGVEDSETRWKIESEDF